MGLGSGDGSGLVHERCSPIGPAPWILRVSRLSACPQFDRSYPGCCLASRLATLGIRRRSRLGRYASLIASTHSTIECCHRWQGTSMRVLGHVLAHEIGHVLQGALQHSDRGVLNVAHRRHQVLPHALPPLAFLAHPRQEQHDRRLADCSTTAPLRGRRRVIWRHGRAGAAC